MFDESPSQAWSLRYGAPAPELLDSLGRFLNHRSVRRFSDREVSDSLVEALIAAGMSAATSSGLQLTTLVSVQDLDRRAKIVALTGDQHQVKTAPWFFAVVADLARIERIATEHGVNPNGLEYFELLATAMIDASLFAERMVCAAESLGLGTCYIGALRNHPGQVQELLGLPLRTMPVFGLCLGWPDEASPADIKPRFNPEDVWHREVYDRSLDTSDYDSRMHDFYVSQGMKTDHTWSQRMARRVTVAQMSGREKLREFLDAQGLDMK